MGRLAQERHTRWKEFRNMSAEICSKGRRSCMRKLEGTSSSLYLTMRFTQGKFMICSIIMRNWRFKKTNINRSSLLDCLKSKSTLLRRWWSSFSSVHQSDRLMLQLLTTPLQDLMLSVQYVSTKSLKTADKTNESNKEHFFLLISLALSEHRTLNITTRKDELKELRLTPHCLL